MPYLSTLAMPERAAMTTQEKDFQQPSASVLRNLPQCGTNYVDYISKPWSTQILPNNEFWGQMQGSSDKTVLFAYTYKLKAPDRESHHYPLEV